MDHPIPDVPVTIGQRACFPAAHLTTVPLEGVEPSQVVWPPAPATTAASSRPSANAPKLTSPDPAPPNQRASLPHEPRTNRRRTRNADGTFDLSRRRVRHEQ